MRSMTFGMFLFRQKQARFGNGKMMMFQVQNIPSFLTVRFLRFLLVVFGSEFFDCQPLVFPSRILLTTVDVLNQHGAESGKLASRMTFSWEPVCCNAMRSY